MIIQANTIVDERFEILSLLGIGGLGAVYKARQVNLNRVVALKFLHVSIAGEWQEKERLHREALVLSELNHRSIVTFYGLGVWQSYPYLAMEYVEGVTLQTMLGDGQPLPFEVSMRIGINMCEAMEAAHSRGIVHRDLKPVNILIVGGDASQPAIKLIDFGLAKLLPEFGQEVQKLTQTGVTVGTVLYMSPEQCVGRGSVDARCDIYSAGAILYHCISGEPPFLRDDNVGLMMAHMTERPKPLTRVDASSEHYRIKLDLVLGKALAKDPQDRYGTAAEFLEDLQRVERGQQPAAAYQSPKKNTFLVGSRKNSPRAIARIAVIAAVLTGLLGIIGFAVHKTDSGTVVKERPRAAQAWRLEAPRVKENRDLHTAVATLKSVLALNKKDGSLNRNEVQDIYQYLCSFYFRQHNIAEGIAVIQEATTEGCSVWRWQAMICSAIGSNRPAEISDSQVKLLTPQIERYLREAVSADNFADTRLADFGKDCEILNWLIALRGTTLSDLQDCEQFFQKLRKSPSKGSIGALYRCAFQIAKAYEKLQDKQKALEWCLKAWELARSNKIPGESTESICRQITDSIMLLSSPEARSDDHNTKQCFDCAERVAESIPCASPDDHVWRLNLSLRMHRPAVALSHWRFLPKGNPDRIRLLSGIAYETLELKNFTEQKSLNQLLLPRVLALEPEIGHLSDGDWQYCSWMLLQEGRICRIIDLRDRKQFDDLFEVSCKVNRHQSNFNQNGLETIWVLATLAEKSFDAATADRVYEEALYEASVAPMNAREMGAYSFSLIGWSDYCKDRYAAPPHTIKLARNVWLAVELLAKRMGTLQPIDVARLAVCEESLGQGDCGQKKIEQLLSGSQVKSSDSDIVLLLRQYRSTAQCKHEAARVKWLDDVLARSGIKVE